ncbi:P-loop NTPase family protein [Qipengyuania gaetbuli]|nr:topology modulation protein [Qipengyuania gaetbuli]
MDHLGWLPGWVETDKHELREKLGALVATDRWLIEGNYGSTLDLRLPRADAIIYLDFPIGLCLWRLMLRVFRHRGTTRPDMTEGCPERFDLEFFLYVLFWNRGPRPRTEQALEGHQAKIIRLRGPKELKRWLAAL